MSQKRTPNIHDSKDTQGRAQARKLQLHRETLRGLTQGDLGQVAGGQRARTDGCPESAACTNGQYTCMERTAIHC